MDTLHVPQHSIRDIKGFFVVNNTIYLAVDDIAGHKVFIYRNDIIDFHAGIYNKPIVSPAEVPATVQAVDPMLFRLYQIGLIVFQFASHLANTILLRKSIK
jgi:hypothetical protein